MRDNELILRTEDFVKQAFESVEGNLSIAHDFKHVDRVRNWALIVARGEGYTESEKVEVTALLHDIGLTDVNNGTGKKGYVTLPPHGPRGAEIAEKFLQDNSDLNAEEIGQITDVIRHHSVSPYAIAEHLRELGKKGKLTEIIRDSDNLDALGAVGLMRAFTSKHFLTEYDPFNIKGDAWELTPDEYQEKFGIDSGRGLAPVNTIIDQVNQQIRYYDHLNTKTAKNIATPLTQFMKDFVIQLEHEITIQ